MNRKNPNALILLPKLCVANANAISGPLSWGFPAASAFTGFVHALHRNLGDGHIVTDDLDLEDGLSLDGVGIICHHFDPQVNKARGTYRYRFNLSKNPVDAKKKIGKDGELQGASFVEEGRVHLEISLLIGVHGYLDEEDGEKLALRVAQAAQLMRLAGGSILPVPDDDRYRPRYLELSDTQEGAREIFRGLRRRLLPGFALVHRHGLLMEHLEELRNETPDATVLDALLDLSQLKVDPVVTDPEKPDKVEWQARRAKPGWLVPLPVGYGAISPLYKPGTVKNARDNELPFRFVESLYSLGEWISPHRIKHTRELLWYHKADPKNGIYLCDHQSQNHATAD